MRVIKHIQNELALKLHQLDWPPNISAFWDQAIMLNKCTYFLAACHLCANPVLVTAKEAMMYATITDWQVEAPETPESFARM